MELCRSHSSYQRNPAHVSMLGSFVQGAKATFRRAGAVDQFSSDRTPSNACNAPEVTSSAGAGQILDEEEHVASSSKAETYFGHGNVSAASAAASSFSRSFSKLKTSGTTSVTKAMLPLTRALGGDPEAGEIRTHLNAYKVQLSAAVAEHSATAAKRREERDLLTKALAEQENDLRCWGYLSVLPAFREHRRYETMRAQLRTILAELHVRVLTAKRQEVNKVLRSMPIIGSWSRRPMNGSRNGVYSSVEVSGRGEVTGPAGWSDAHVGNADVDGCDTALVVPPTELLAADEGLDFAKQQVAACDRQCATAADAFAMKVVEAGGLEPRSAEDRAETVLALVTRYHVLGETLASQRPSTMTGRSTADRDADKSTCRYRDEQLPTGDYGDECAQTHQTAHGAPAVPSSGPSSDPALDDRDTSRTSSSTGASGRTASLEAVDVAAFDRARKGCEEKFVELMSDERTREGRLLRRFLVMAQAKKSPQPSSEPPTATTSTTRPRDSSSCPPAAVGDRATRFTAGQGVDDDWEGAVAVDPRVVKAFINYFSKEYLGGRFDIPGMLIPSLTDLVASLVFRRARRLVLGFDRRRVTTNDTAWREKAARMRSVPLRDLGVSAEYLPASRKQPSASMNRSDGDEVLAAGGHVACRRVEDVPPEGWPGWAPIPGTGAPVDREPEVSAPPRPGREPDEARPESCINAPSAAAVDADFVVVAPAHGLDSRRSSVDSVPAVSQSAKSPETTTAVFRGKSGENVDAAMTYASNPLPTDVADVDTGPDCPTPEGGELVTANDTGSLEAGAHKQEAQADAPPALEGYALNAEHTADATGGGAYGRASAVFSLLGDCVTPAEMLAVLKRGAVALAEDAEKISGFNKPLDADALLPLLVYALVRADLPRVHEALNFIRNFTQPSYLGGEHSYYVTSVEAAVSFVLEWTPERDGTDNSYPGQCATTSHGADAPVLRHGDDASSCKIDAPKAPAASHGVAGQTQGGVGDSESSGPSPRGSIRDEEERRERRERQEGLEALMRLGIFLENHEVHEDTVDSLSSAGWL